MVTGWIQLTTGTYAKFGTGSGSGGTEFLLEPPVGSIRARGSIPRP